MKARKLLLTISLLLILLFAGTLSVFAEEDGGSYHYAQVFDEAGLFSESQVLQLETLCEDITLNYDIDVIILTTLQIPETRKQYLEDYYDSRDTELSDTLLLLLNMDPNDRGIEIQGYGSCEHTFPYERLEVMLDAIFPYLKSGDYYSGMEEFCTQAKHFLEADRTAAANPQPSVPSESSGIRTQDGNSSQDSIPVSAAAVREPIPHTRNLVIAALIAALCVGIMFYRSSGRMTAHQGTYLDSSNSRVLGSYDRYIRTTTSRRPKPKPQESNHGHTGGGGVSSGGHSHSGSGRSF